MVPAPPLVALSEQPPPLPVTPSPAPFPDNTAKIMNQIRKWGCHFDGKNPVAFLERVDELRVSYDVTDSQLLRG